MTHSHYGTMTGALVLCLVLAGCASEPERPVTRFAAAEASIKQAERSGARRYSSGELDTARHKLSQAKASSERGEHEQAARLAHEAKMDAQFASAAAETAKTQEVVDVLDSSIETLQSEIRYQRQEGQQ